MDYRVWVYAILFNTVIWWIMSKICCRCLVLDTAGDYWRDPDVEARLDEIEADYHTERPDTVIGRQPSGNDTASSSARAGVNYGDNIATLRHRRGAISANETQSALRLLQENPNCLLGRDTGDIRRVLEARGSVFEVSGSQWELAAKEYPVTAGQHIQVAFSQTWKRQEGMSLKQAWLQRWYAKPEDQILHILRNRYGLEISACTGHSRRISLIEVMFTSTMKPVFEAFTWKYATARKAILKAIEEHNADDFIHCYANNPDWRQDIGGAITACLNLLKHTGVDRKNNSLTALSMFSPMQAQLVRFSNKFYPWVDLLEDTTRSFTMAVITDSCLMLPGLPGMSACKNTEEISDSLKVHGAVVLETQLHIDDHKTSAVNAKNSNLDNGEKSFSNPVGPGLRLYLNPEKGHGSGSLRVMDTSVENFLFALWGRDTRPEKSKGRVKHAPPTFVEYVDHRESVNPIITYILSSWTRIQNPENRKDKKDE
jgi:hypothetical protein